MARTRRTMHGRRCRRSPLNFNPGGVGVLRSGRKVGEFTKEVAKEAMSTAQYAPEITQDTNPMDGAQTGVGKNEMDIERENQ